MGESDKRTRWPRERATRARPAPRAAALALGLVLTGLGGRALAQNAPLDKNDYALELFQGPLLAPTRVSGLAGATTAIADSVEGVYNNAAAPAVREAASVKWFEWEPSVAIALPGVYGGTDFNNRGEEGIDRNRRLGRRRTVETADNFLYLQGGVWTQFGALGLSVTADMIRFNVAAPQEATPSLALTLTRFHAVGAYSFFGNQLCIGAGVRAVYVNVDEVDGKSTAVIAMLGAAPQVGVIVKPDGVPWRIGATVRAAVEASPLSVGRIIESTPVSGDTIRSAGSFVLPDRITQPWELEAGVAYQLGPRPLNPRWIDPHQQERAIERRIEEARAARRAYEDAERARLPGTTVADREARDRRLRALEEDDRQAREAEETELGDARQRLYEERRARYQNWPRERILLLASLLLTGPSAGAVALEGFLNRERELVGQTVSVAPRFAVETEPITNLLKFRSGIYFEPSRFTDGSHRQHFTFGADVKLFAWDVLGLSMEQTWRLSSFLDVGPRYQNFGFAIGVWR